VHFEDPAPSAPASIGTRTPPLQGEEEVRSALLATCLRNYELATGILALEIHQWDTLETAISAGSLSADDLMTSMKRVMERQRSCYETMDDMLLAMRGLIGTSARNLTASVVKRLTGRDNVAEMDEGKSSLRDWYPQAFTSSYSSRDQAKFFDRKDGDVDNWFAKDHSQRDVQGFQSELEEIRKAHTNVVTPLNSLKTCYNVEWPIITEATMRSSETIGLYGVIDELAKTAPIVTPTFGKDVMGDILTLFKAHFGLMGRWKSHTAGVSVRAFQSREGNLAE
jgi:hypothetical protein